MWYFVVCSGAVVYSTDSAREAHREARRATRDKQNPAFVARVVCRWDMTAVRSNAK